jgi:hypothetical protein
LGRWRQPVPFRPFRPFFLPPLLSVSSVSNQLRSPKQILLTPPPIREKPPPMPTISDPAYIPPPDGANTSFAILEVADAAARLALPQPSAVGRAIKQLDDNSQWALVPGGNASDAASWRRLGDAELDSAEMLAYMAANKGTVRSAVAAVSYEAQDLSADKRSRTRSNIGAAPQSSSLPFRIAFCGDSITNTNYYRQSKTGPIFGNSYGYAVWARILLNGRFEPTARTNTENLAAPYINMLYPDLDHGYDSRLPSDYLLTRCGSLAVTPARHAIDSNPDAFFVCIGTTSLNGYTEQDACNQVMSLLNYFRTETGKPVWAATLIPRAGNFTYPVTEPCNDKIGRFNALLIAACAADGIPCLDWNAAVAGTTTAYLVDGVHPNCGGGFFMGKALAAFLADKIATQEHPVPAYAAGLWANQYSDLIGATFTNGKAANISAYLGSGANVGVAGDFTWTEVASEDGKRWQKVTIANNAGRYKRGLSVANASGTIAAAAAAGYRLRPVCRIKSDASGWDVNNVGMETYVFGGNSVTQYALSDHVWVDPSAAAPNAVIDPLNGLIFGEPFALDAGSTSATLYLTVRGNGTFQVTDFGLQIVP